MIYYYIIALPFLLMFTSLLLTNFIIPHFKKKGLYNQVKERPDWLMIENTDHTLKRLFKGTHAKTTSIIYRNMHWIRSKEFIYGEIDFLSFYTILEKTKPQPHEVFYDLGSGAGKAVFTAALFFNLSKSCGIELLPPLYKKATGLLQKLNNDVEKRYLAEASTIQFINDSFFNYNFCDANIIYVAATCLSDPTWEKLINILADLKPGSRIIVATRTIDHHNFELTYQGVELMSWGLCPVKIYKIIKC